MRSSRVEVVDRPKDDRKEPKHLICPSEAEELCRCGINQSIPRAAPPLLEQSPQCSWHLQLPCRPRPSLKEALALGGWCRHRDGASSCVRRGQAARPLVLQPNVPVLVAPGGRFRAAARSERDLQWFALRTPAAKFLSHKPLAARTNSTLQHVCGVWILSNPRRQRFA